MSLPSILPSLDQLPLNDGDPPNSAWGLWGDGPQSALGSLNYLSDDLTAKTIREEVRSGERVGLNLPLDFFNPPLLGRAGFEQRMIDKSPLVVNDDVITFNTQGSSQWDSLRHFAYQKDKQFYNGQVALKTFQRAVLTIIRFTQQDIYAADRTPTNGLQAWSDKGLAGRGVLIDYASYAQRNRISVDHFSAHGITLEDVKDIAAEEGIEFRKGDVLFLRTGYVGAYAALDGTQRARIAGVREWCGLAQSRETTEWLWERQFAAVASDSPGFEVRPPTDPQWHLHPILLAGWGTPIGELFDLEGIAELCRKSGRWSFFFTSAPLNYAGAVASPPNALAIM